MDFLSLEISYLRVSEVYFGLFKLLVKSVIQVYWFVCWLKPPWGVKISLRMNLTIIVTRRKALPAGDSSFLLKMKQVKHIFIYFLLIYWTLIWTIGTYSNQGETKLEKKSGSQNQIRVPQRDITTNRINITG